MKSLGVVIPIYNTELYLRKCIESILKQNMENLKVVLVDDGSSDSSPQISDEYALKDSRVQVIHQTNKGKIESRYTGAVQLKTDYITFVDSDDWISEGAYTILCEYMEKEIDVISYKIVRYVNDDYQIKSGGKIKEGLFLGEDYRNNICSAMIWDEEINSCGVDPSLCNKLFKREILMPQLEKAREICVGYGDDVAVVYPTLYAANSYAIVDSYKYYHRRRFEGQIPEYFLDENYYKNLTGLYEYLRNRFENSSDYVRQLDMFFSYSASLRLRKYGTEYKSVRYLVPFDQVPPKSRVVLYGAGKVGKAYYKQINELGYCDIIAWVDKQKKQSEGIEISNCEVLKDRGFDYVLIALKSKEAAEEIAQMLRKEYDVKSDRIIWGFHEYFE